MSQYLSLNVVDAVLGTIGQLIHISTSLISTPLIPLMCNTVEFHWHSFLLHLCICLLDFGVY